MQTLMQDVRYGLRMLRKSPGLTVIILIMLDPGNRRYYGGIYGLRRHPAAPAGV